eukprot:TRINITY_DN298_c0_g2_i2.p1 TRINITY_DN298_c0_g2~~TRINITY_DN298_c0_g2_i2.p1  ORF type:complete len:1600 (-),score=108.51 TRINITY_DN298_c0_g2_i2:6731-11431(-)
MDIWNYHPTLGVFTFLTFMSTLYGLSRVFGRPTSDRIDRYIVCKKWPFITEENYLHYVLFFRIVYYLFSLMPFITIPVWVGIMFYLRKDDTYVGPISVLLVGLAGMCIVLGQRLIIWRRYRVTYPTVVFTILSVVCIVAYQLLGNFYYSLTHTFFGISALFLSYNCIVIILLIYLNIGKGFITFSSILRKYIKPKAEGFEPHLPEKDLAQCLEEDKQNDRYALTVPEYKAFFTLNISNSGLGSTGLVNMFASLTKRKQTLANMGVYFFGLCMLGAYSGMTFLTEQDKLGIVVSIAVVTTDIILYAMYHSGVVVTVSGGSLMAIIFRGCLFGFGGRNWYFGCCLLYAIAGIKLAWEKVNRQFPFVETQKYSSKEPAANPKLQAKYKKDMFREPLMVWLFSTVMFAILTIILAYVKPSGVPLPIIFMGDSDAPFWLMAIFALLFTVLCYVLLATVRISQRKSMSYVAKTYKYCLFEGVGEFWMYFLLGYAVIVCISLILYAFVDNPLIIIYSVFSPLIALILIFGITNYVKNHYSILYKFHLEARRERVKENRYAKPEGIVLQVNNDYDISANNHARSQFPQKAKDWRKKHTAIKAFFKCLLPTRDYKIILSISLSLLVTFFFAFTIQSLGNASPYPPAWIGVTTGVMVFCCISNVGPLLDHLSNGMPVTIQERVVLSIGLIIYVGYGIGFYQGREHGDMDIHYNVYTLPIYAAVYPGIISALMGLYARYAQGKVSNTCIILWGVSVACIGVFVGYVFRVFGNPTGIFLLIIVVFLVLAATLFGISDYLSYSSKASSLIVAVGIACVIMVYNFIAKTFDGFLGFSISYLLITLGVFIAATYKLGHAIWNSRTAPVLFSGFIFPVYRYNQNQGYPVLFNGPVYVIYISMGAFMFWTVLLSIYVEPMYYGVTAGLFTLVLAVVLSLVLSSYSSYKYGQWEKYITDKVINNSWLKAKGDYIGRQGATTLKELQTFNQTYTTKKRLLALDSENTIQPKNRLTAQSPTNRDNDYLRLSYMKKLIWLHKTDRRIAALYKTEITFIVHVEMLALIAAQNSSYKEQQELVHFIRSQKADLRQHSIYINLENITDLETRYYCALSQKEGLTPEQQVAFNQEWAKYQENKMAKAAKQKEYEKKVAEKLRAKLGISHDSTSGENVTKYKRIIEEFERSGTKFTDPEFPRDERSLGETLVNRVAGWKRASEDLNAKILHENIGAMDIIQGALGDCYLLSAMSVMGKAGVRFCILTDEAQAKSGAYLVKMYRAGDYEEYLIIDDYFPVNQENEWAFAHCGPIGEDGKKIELWPMIIEKAYAKFYKSYEQIEGGKVHITLAELTGGVPQYIQITDSICDNIDQFWQKLYTYYENGYMLGAGTPEHSRGDSAINENGIVQGHAYAILDVKAYSGEHLVKLRNPQGSRGIEWNGDWGDESPLWTPAAVQALNHEINNDGIFWINIRDFVDEFKYVYVCRKFDKRWTRVHLERSCSGEYSLRDDGFDKFPQYKVSITKPTTIFVKLTQSEKVNSYQGMHSVFIILLANDGRKAQTSDSPKTVCSSLPLWTCSIRYHAALQWQLGP